MVLGKNQVSDLSLSGSLHITLPNGQFFSSVPQIIMLKKKQKIKPLEGGEYTDTKRNVRIPVFFFSHDQGSVEKYFL